MKHLLMIVPFFPPMAGGGVYRPLGFVRHLGRHGWRVTVVAPRGRDYWIHDSRLTLDLPGDCRVIRTSSLSGQALLARGRRHRVEAGKRSSGGFAALRRISSMLLLPDAYIGWYVFAVRAARSVVATDAPDAIYSTSPPETSHLVGLRLHRDTGLPWIADFRDPWMNLYLLRPPTGLHRRFHRRLERRVVSGAHVVVTTRWHDEKLRQSYRGARVTRIANGYDGSEIEPVVAASSPTEGAIGPMRIVHAGMLTQNRSAAVFLRAIAIWRDRHRDDVGGPGLDVAFIGPREDRNDREAHRLELDGVVSFRDSLPHDEVLRLERRAHLLLLIKHDNPAYNGIVPGKLFEYIGLRRPILALVPEGEARAIVEDLNRGLAVDPGDEAAIARTVERLYDAYRNGVLDAGFDLSPRTEFDRIGRVGELARLLNEMCAKGARR